MERSGTRRNWVALIVFLALSYAVAGIGLLATIPNIPGWYAEAVKPGWTPPNALFGPVWTLLYALIAVAAWLLVPYLLWCLYAMTLNAGLAALNG